MTLMNRERPLSPLGPMPGGVPSCRLAQGLDMFGQSWAGRRVLVVGLGRSGLAAATLLARAGCRVRVTEAADTETLRSAAASLSAHGIEAVELGRHTETFFEGTESVVASPGVPESQGPLRWAKRHGVPILSEIELAFHFCPSPVVAVTGTNGKSTTVTLITQLLNASGRPAVACGNIGIPFTSVVDQLSEDMIAVVEVSSFQLLHCTRFKPAIGVLLNIGTNHLDRHEEVHAYLAAKARLFQAQTSHEWAVINGRDPRLVVLSEAWQAKRVWFAENHSNPQSVWLDPQTCRSLTDGAQAVLQVARLFGIPDPLTWQVIRSFRGLEHRLEHVATIRGVHFINDSKSTTPDSVLFALAHTPGDVVVVLGGRNKGLDFTPLIEPLAHERIRGIVLIGESQHALQDLLRSSTTAPLRTCRSLDAAVRAASEFAEPGASVLFSPACASFDMFRDFEQRGRAFKAIVEQMAQHDVQGIKEPPVVEEPAPLVAPEPAESLVS